MTRIDSMRAATGSARESVLHAAEAVAPYADTARDRATQYAGEARARLAPKVSHAADQAKLQFDARLAPRIEQARTHVPPKLDEAAHVAAKQTRKAAKRTRKAAAQAAEYSRPRIEQARAAAGPVREEATARSAAALTALRGQVSPKEIERLAKKHQRRGRAGRTVRGLAVLGLLAGGAFAAWKWWDKQANPDWLVEPPAATEVPEAATGLNPVDGTPESTGLDPEVEAKQAESDEDGRAG